MEIRSMGCCGVREIAGLKYLTGRDGMIKVLCGDKTSWSGSYYGGILSSLTVAPTCLGQFIFTEADVPGINYNYGQQFAAFIRKNKLGSVTKSRKTANNPNHPTHKITVWIWSPDCKRLWSWWEKTKEYKAIQKAREAAEQKRQAALKRILQSRSMNLSCGKQIISL